MAQNAVMKARARKSGTIRWRPARWLAAIGLLSAFLASLDLRAQPIAQGGSPLYLLAVRESVAGLESRPNATPQAAAANGAGVVPLNTNQVARDQSAPTPALPAALNRYYYYCTNCAAYHLRTTPLPDALSTNLGLTVPQGATNHLPARTNAPPANGPGH